MCVERRTGHSRIRKGKRRILYQESEDNNA
jgi:hypothetical protein